MSNLQKETSSQWFSPDLSLLIGDCNHSAPRSVSMLTTTTFECYFFKLNNKKYNDICIKNSPGHTMQINLEIEFKDLIVHCTMYCTSCELEKVSV